MLSNLDDLKKTIKRYFSVHSERVSDQQIQESISKDAKFQGANLWVLMFAILIASLGLNVNSTAVIIGAMLISPLMGPIIGMGFAVGTNDLALLKSSFKNYLVATAIGVITATVYFILTPFHGAESELLARTSPTFYDVLIALFGGAAGFVIMATGGKGNVIPGVAIATALMPPLCTAGYGLAAGHIGYFLGAFYLFFINTIFIAFATYLGAQFMRFKHKVFLERKTYLRVRRYIIIIASATVIPAIVLTVLIIRDSVISDNLDNFVENEFNAKGTQIVSQSIIKENKSIRLVAIGREVGLQEIEEAQEKLRKYKIRGYTLDIIQGSQYDSILALRENITESMTSMQNMNMSFLKSLQEQQTIIRDLTQKIDTLTVLNKELRDELETVRQAVPKSTLKRK